VILTTFTKKLYDRKTENCVQMMLLLFFFLLKSNNEEGVDEVIGGFGRRFVCCDFLCFGQIK